MKALGAGQDSPPTVFEVDGGRKRLIPVPREQKRWLICVTFHLKNDTATRTRKPDGR